MKKMLWIVLMFLILMGLCACGKKQTITVVFDSLGGTSIESQSIKQGDCATKPTDPFKKGFTFVEWQWDNKSYDFKTPVQSNILLTAFYSVNEGTEIICVAFDADNGDAIKSVNIAKNSAISEPPTPEKQGFVFKGWYFEDEKYDFDTILNENTCLTAKWEVDEKASGTNDQNKGNVSNGFGTTTSNSPNSSTHISSSSQNKTICFADVQGLWYAEGRDDVTLEITLYDNVWVYLKSFGFDHFTGIIEPHSGHGSTDYYYKNGYFDSNEIKVESSSKLIYTINGNTIVFYRQKNYPNQVVTGYKKLLEEIDGYYWYLDGYSFTYLYPTVIPWYGHEILNWESNNINMTQNRFVAYENLEPDAYAKEDEQGPEHTHNTLLVNPIEFADSLIKDFKMRVNGNKLYMEVGGREYSFTKSASEKPIVHSMQTQKSNITVSVGETFDFDVQMSPWWKDYYIDVQTGGAVGLLDQTDDYRGNLHYTFEGRYAGTDTITLTESHCGAKKTINVTVNAVLPSAIALNESSLTLTKGDTSVLTATIIPASATGTVTWVSSDPNVATVSSKGKVTAQGFGNATITATTIDGMRSASCSVTVNQKALAVEGVIGVRSITHNSSYTQGVFATATASGGSENYVEYYIRLYKDEVLIGEIAREEIFVTPLVKGTYRAEIYVKDSDGHEATTTEITTISF